jgi:glycosyltransferase involved in cell wall biosynthesis
MIIAFHSNAISLRGTEVALYDYAHYNEEILGNESIIISNRNDQHNTKEVIEKFEKRFGKIHWYSEKKEIDNIVNKQKADIFYTIKHGHDDGVITKEAKCCVHAVFRQLEPHGDVYAVISEWMSKVVSEGKYDYVPHIINLPEVNLHFREHLNIPEDATVFGRYGGLDTFDLEFVHEVVKKIAVERPDIYFLFMNTDNFLKGYKIENIRFLTGTTDEKVKVAFINTCDAMLHARLRGETFGLAVGEFSSKNKPVITFARSPEQAHFWHLKEKGIYYFDDVQLVNILKSFTKNNNYNYDAFSNEFSPEKVIQRFKKVFIEG